MSSTEPRNNGRNSTLATVSRYAPVSILVLLISTYIVVFGTLTWQQQSNFGTFDYDMGIYDQGIWLLSRFEEAFLTVRGIHFFGHHVNFITLLIVPFYWLGADPHFLYIFQTIVMALGAVPVWLITLHLLGNRWIALAPAAAFLLYPSLGWINWWHFHPDALAITPLLFSWYFMLARRWALFAFCIALSLSAKEDVAIAVAAMGVIIAFSAVVNKYRFKKYFKEPEQTGNLASKATHTFNKTIYIGLGTALVGIAWWELCSKVLLPYFNGYSAGAFYASFFPGFGNTPFEVLSTIINNPSLLIEKISSDEHLTYYLEIFAPTGFLALLSPVTWIAAPQLLVNSISAHSYTHQFQYHYTSIVLTGIFLGSIHTIAWARKYCEWLKVILPVFLLLTSVYTHVQWSPSPLGKSFKSGVWAKPNEKHEVIRTALKLVPDNANVTATYYIVPHLTHRKKIYGFPNPFRVVYWGHDGTNGHDPGEVDHLVIDTQLTGSHRDLYEDLVGEDGPFEVILSSKNIELARRKNFLVSE